MFIFCYNLSFERKIFVYKLIIQFFNIYYDFGQKTRAHMRGHMYRLAR
jgi:hypothetical protein